MTQDTQQSLSVLVLGADGMLSRDVIKTLKLKYEVCGRDCGDFDITEENTTRQRILEIDPDIVINTAAFTDVDGCEVEVEKAFMVNAQGAKNVALACKEGKIKLVHISTDYVFDGTKFSPYLEDDPPHPLSVYGKSKLEGEQYVKEIGEDFCIIRTAWLYGRRGKNFVHTILRLAKTEKELTIVDDQIGPPTCTYDLACAIDTLLVHNPEGVYHITNGGACSWYEFAVEILKLAHMNTVKVKPVGSDVYVRPAKRPAYSVLDCSKFEKETGLFLRPWKDALKEFLLEDSALCSQ
ncbi:MAG: dTDP-4-dehydrorhamnose reductase [Thermodesulfobacteriota bacterium]|nr:dTDP-4-dehydrorhamnose reductase [Thermodesulfobacteriota bacterium]